MKEYEIYVPVKSDGGASGADKELEEIKSTLAKTFGGYTHLKQRNEGAWSMGGVTFFDAITILRVLDDGTSQFDMVAFKKRLEEMFHQESVLIVERSVSLVA